MPTTGDDLRDAGDATSAHAEVHRAAWNETLGDARRMAEGRATEGWETLVLPAGHTAPEPPDTGPEGRFGLVHVVPGNRADALADLLSFATFPSYDVYRTTVNGRVFIVTELDDPELDVAVYVAGSYELRHVKPLVVAAAKYDRMYTHVQRLDETPLGSFEHADWRKFFPDPDRFL